MHKKIIAMLLICLGIFLSTSLPLYAYSSHNIIDNLGYLTEDEIASLQDFIDSITNFYKFDTVIVITDDTDGKTSQKFADDFYDYNNYRASGILMLINMDKREVHISTSGNTIDIFTDTRINEMLGNATGYLSEGDYYNACFVFIGNVQLNAYNGVPSNKDTYLTKVVLMIKNLRTYIIALILAIAATFIVSFSSKGKTTTTHLTYEKGGTFALSKTRDNFIRESTSRTKIQRNSPSHGKSSTHRGSSGRTHGGGGRKF